MAKRFPITLSSFVVLLWLVSFGLMLQEGNRTRKAVVLLKQSVNPLSSFSAGEQLTSNEFSESDHLLLYGDLSQASEAERWKALYESSPEDPAYYADYLACLDHIPDDFHETVERIDPENGWFIFWEVSMRVDNAIKRSRRPNKSKSNRNNPHAPPAEYEILDQAELQSLMALLGKASVAGSFDPYFGAMMKRRFEVLPPADNTLSYLSNLSVMIGKPSDAIKWKKVDDLMSAGFQAAQNAGEFEQLKTVSIQLQNYAFATKGGLIDGLIAKAVIASQTKAMRAAAERLALEEEAEAYRSKEKAFFEQSKLLEARDDPEAQDLLYHRASVFMLLSVPAFQRLVENPPELTRDMLYPSLRTERALAARIVFASFTMVMTIIALSVWLWKRGKQSPATFLPNKSVLGLGVLLPFAALLIFRYFLSFGMLGYGAKVWFFGNYLFPEIALFFVLLTVPICLLKYQAEPDRATWKTWWPVGIALLALISSAAIPHLGYLTGIIIAGILLTITFFWLLWTALNKNKSDVDFAGRLAPAYFLAAALMGFFVVGLAAEERYWFAKDEVGKQAVNGFSQFEAQVAEILWLELAEFQREQ